MQYNSYQNPIYIAAVINQTSSTFLTATWWKKNSFFHVCQLLLEKYWQSLHLVQPVSGHSAQQGRLLSEERHGTETLDGNNFICSLKCGVNIERQRCTLLMFSSVLHLLNNASEVFHCMPVTQLMMRVYMLHFLNICFSVL